MMDGLRKTIPFEFGEQAVVSVEQIQQRDGNPLEFTFLCFGRFTVYAILQLSCEGGHDGLQILDQRDAVEGVPCGKRKRRLHLFQYFPQ